MTDALERIGAGDTLLAGFAEVDITPSADVLTADGKQRRRFEVYDPLMARILCLRQGDRTAAVIGLDTFELGIDFERRLAARLDGAGLTAESLVLCPSHVGATPISSYGAYIILFAQDLVIETYEEECAARLAAGIRQALDTVAPVNVAFGRGRAPDVLHNRRFIRPDGTVEMIGVGRQGSARAELVQQGVDDSVDVLRFDTAGGDPLGALVTFACHAVCSSDKYGGITADYPQHVAEVFRRVLGIPAVFTQGGLGDLVPNYVNGDAAQRTGRAVGAQALYVYERLDPAPGGALEAHYAEVTIPARLVDAEQEDMRTHLRNSHARYRQFVHDWYAKHPTITYPMRALALGDVCLLQLAGEVFHSTVLAIKEASPFRHTTVVCRATREVGYVCTPEAYGQGGMEPSLSAVAPPSEPIIREAAIDLLRAAHATHVAPPQAEAVAA